MSYSQKILQRGSTNKEQVLQKEVLFCNREGSTYSSVLETIEAEHQLHHGVILLLQAGTKLANLTPSDIIQSIFSECRLGV